MTQRNLFQDPPTPPTSMPPASTNPLAMFHTSCQRCGSTDYTDHVLDSHNHAGKSTRRDCRRCGWTFGFPRWYGCSEREN